MTTKVQTPEMIAEIRQTAADLLQALEAFNEHSFNQVPFEGSWTAGQVAEHLLLSCSAEALYANTTETLRAPGEKLEQIRAVFLDFTAKYQSPDPIVPQQTVHHKDATVRELAENWHGIANAAATLDLNASVQIEIPFFGILTRLELVYLMVYHTQRHTRQLKAIAEKVAA